MTDQLSLYNGALRILGQSKLADLAEDVEPRYVLDEIWDDGARDDCLEQGQWNFAIRTVEGNYNTGIEPDFGFTRAFDKPSDWMRTVSIAADDRFFNILTDHRYKDEADFWFADLDIIYIRYVSNDNSYGYDFAKWPKSFVKFVEAYLAFEARMRLLQSESKRRQVEQEFKDAKTSAMSKDAMNNGVVFPPEGAWAGARRQGRRNSRWGNR